jgi:hypothetical protein
MSYCGNQRAMQPGELARQEVRHQLVDGAHVVSPGEHFAVETAARRLLPFGLGRELCGGQLGVPFGVLIADVRDGVVPAV